MDEKRKNLRLKGYDYSKRGAYFVTICTQNRTEFFGALIPSSDENCNDIIDAHLPCRGDPCGRPYVSLSPLGCVAVDVINTIENMFPCHIVEYIIMPDHIHLVLFLNIERTTDALRLGECAVAPTEDSSNNNVTLGRIIGAYKSIISNIWRKQCNQINIRANSIWQRGYFEHIIRSPDELYQIRKYIRENPLRKYYSEAD